MSRSSFDTRRINQPYLRGQRRFARGSEICLLIRVSYTALDAKELEGRLTEAEIKAADPRTRKQYFAVVKKKFEAANPDNDGTVDLKELESPAGQELAQAHLQIAIFAKPNGGSRSP